MLLTSSPAAAADHPGDICTIEPHCNGAAKFVQAGDHLYVYDNRKDGYNVVVRYYREDTGNQENHAWNTKGGADTTYDHNMNMPEGDKIEYQVCLGVKSSGTINWSSCSAFRTEYA